LIGINNNNNMTSDNEGQWKKEGFRVGDRVVLKGLKQASHLNGRHGHIG
jgi:hypothetical protein